MSATYRDVSMGWDAILAELGPGDKVTYTIHGGLELKRGKAVPVRQTVEGRIMIHSGTHLVTRRPGRDMPDVCEEANFIAAHKARRRLLLQK